MKVMLGGFDLRQRAKAKVEECYRVAEKIFGKKYPLPSVVFDLKGHTAGYAHYQENKIRLNIDLLTRYTDDMINDTIPHEVAHLIAYQKYGRQIGGSPHGAEWRHVAEALGCNGKRTHSYETKPARVTRQFLYTCPCENEFKVGVNLHKKMQNWARQRICRECKGYLIFVRQVR